MRHVLIRGEPPEKWLKKAKQITELLQKASSNKKERDKIIKKYEKHWKEDEFRSWLINQFYGKCWYSESKENASAYHVDHFRPKGRVKEIDGKYREGYWWLAFRWENYRISGQLLNVKKQDVFPLSPYGHPAKAFDDKGLELESPILIDPCDEDDAGLISFNEGGEAACADGIDDDDKVRVETTIEAYGLNSCAGGRLVESRASVWNKCELAILDYNNASVHAPQLKKVQRILIVKKLKELSDCKEEFSAVALACIKKKASEALQKQVVG
jgi:hypothetical protein